MNAANDPELLRWITYMETPIAELEGFGLCSKAVSILETQRGVVWIKQLQYWEPADLQKIPNFGKAFQVMLLRAMSDYWRSLA